MRQEYDFSKMKSRRNPYASKLKRQVIYELNRIELLRDVTPAEHFLDTG
jgi:hypothetical protein